MKKENQTIKVGAGVVIIKGNKTLLTKRKNSHADGSYGSLGGHVEYGESPIETVKREAREELGIEIGNIRFVSCANIVKYGNHYIDITFVAEIVSGEPRICEPARVESIAWYPLNRLPEPLFEPVKVALEALQTGTPFYDVQDS